MQNLVENPNVKIFILDLKFDLKILTWVKCVLIIENYWKCFKLKHFY